MAKYDDHKVSFSGVENVQAFVMQFENVIKLKGIPEDKQPLALINKFSGQALLWCTTLAPETRASYELLKTALLGRYGEEHLSLLNKCALLQVQQKAGQSVDEFYDSIALRCVELKVQEELKLTCLLNGLHQDIKQFVLGKEPKSVQDVVKFARLAETTGLGRIVISSPVLTPECEAINHSNQGPSGWSRGSNGGPVSGQHGHGAPRPSFICYRCGRPNHVRRQCRAYTDVHGNSLN
jgi:hypothetical protein